MKKPITGRLAAAIILSFCIIITSNKSFYGKALASDVGKSEDLTDYPEEISSIKIFKDKDNLLSNEELQRLRNLSYKPCTYEFKGSIEDLYNIIILNSNNYLKDTDYSSILEIKEDYIREYVIKTIKDIIKRNLKEERKDNIHKLISLKIVIGSLEEDTLGQYDLKENLIILDMEKILGKSSSIDDINMNLFDCLNHEFNHAFQGSCSGKLINNTSFILESSAESYNYNILKNDYKFVNSRYEYGYAYLEERKYESKLFLLSLLDNKRSIEEYYDAIDKGDIMRLFAFLDLNSIEEQNEFLEGIWLVDGILLRNNYWSRIVKSDDFDSLKDYNIDELLMREAAGAYESFILKMAVKGLMKYNILNDDLSLEDNLLLYYFILINVLDMVSFSDYNYATCEVSYTFYRDFFDHYLRIEEIFFRFLGSYYNYSEEEIKSIDDSLDKDKMVNGINNYLNTGYCLNEDKYIKELIDKYPKIRIIRQSGVILANFNYNNLRNIRDRKYSKDGIKLILK